MNPDQTKGAVWVHIVCNISHKITQAEERADDNFHE